MIGSEPGRDDFNAIDPNPVKDLSGRYWLAFGSYWNGIKLIELDPATMKPKADANMYALASRNGGPIEAAYIVNKRGLYYLFVSFDHCCNGINSDYKIMVGRSYTITGPYADKSGKPMMEGGATLVYDGDDRWRGPGHCAVLLNDNGADWLIYHSYDAKNDGIPTLRISRLGWDAAGWPFIDSTTSIHTQGMVNPVKQPRLFSNYPNPFNGQTFIRFYVNKQSRVKLKIYSIDGREIEILINKVMLPGYYKIPLKAHSIASGIYFYRIEIGSFKQIGKMVFLK